MTSTWEPLALPKAALRIVIPAKNEASRIESTISEYCTYFGDRAAVLVVANGCTDETTSIVRRLMSRYPSLELMEVPTGIGKGGAVRAGMTVGQEPLVAFVDADGSAKAPQLDLLLDMCARSGAAGAIGSRWMPGSTVSRRQPLKRRIASRAFNLLVRLLFDLPYSDTQCGAKVFRRDCIVGVLDHLEIANFAFDVDMLVAMKRFDYPVLEIPIVWADAPDDTKVRIVQAGSSMVASLVRLWLNRSPLGQLPFVDRIGRASAIPVIRGLDVLVLTHEPPSDVIEEVQRTIRQLGHRATVFHIGNVVDVIRFAWWYVSFGHTTYDVIVDAFGSVATRICALSAKPRIVARSARQLLTRNLRQEMSTATKACGYHTVFWRDDDGWILPNLEPTADSIES